MILEHNFSDSIESFCSYLPPNLYFRCNIDQAHSQAFSTDVIVAAPVSKILSHSVDNLNTNIIDIHVRSYQTLHSFSDVYKIA